MSLPPSLFVTSIRILAFAALGFAATANATPPPPFTHFVTRSGDQLFDGPNELRFISTNMPDVLQLITNTGFESTNNLRLPDDYELRDAVLTVKQLGGQVMRTFSVTAKNGTSPYHLFDVSTFPVTPNETAFLALDRLLQLCHAEGVRIYIPLIAYSNSNRGDPATYGPAFWTVGSADNLKFKNMVSQLLNRTNTLTGVPYKNDRAILGWQSGNELVIGSDPVRSAWLHDLAAYVKNLDANHLFLDGRNRPHDIYGLYAPFFADANIDVVSYHTYVNLAAFNTPATTLQAMRAYTAGQRPLIVSEIAMYTTESALNTLLDTQIANGTTGSNWWGHRFRNREGGFYRHSDNGSLFEDLNWPGFPASAGYLPDIQKALNLQNILADHAYEIQGLVRPPLPVPEAPTLLPIADVGHLSWEGPTGAQSYTLQRSGAAGGPWADLAIDIPDHLIVADSLYNDDAAERDATYFYRVIAHNSSGTSAPSNVVGPVTVGTTWLVDNFFHLSLPARTTNVQIAKAYNHYNYSNDLALLKRGTTSSPGEVVYSVDGHLRGITAYLHQSTVAPSFTGSVDGLGYDQIPAAAVPFGSRQFYLATPPAGSNYRYFKLGLNSPSTAEAVGRLEIEYQQLAASARMPRPSPAGGTYATAQLVSLSTLTSGASVRYTTNGSLPAATSGTLYQAPFTVATTTTVNAIAYRHDLASSFVNTASYTIGIATETQLLEAEALALISFGAGTSVEFDGPASGGKWSKLNGSGAGQYVEYTTPNLPAGSYTLDFRYKTGGPRARHTFVLDGVQLGGVIDPYASTSFYRTANLGTVVFTSTGPHTIRLTITDKNSSSSGYLIGADAFIFTPLPTAAAPAFNLPDGLYNHTLPITLTSLTPGAALRYTLDGSTPSPTHGLHYSGPFTLTASATVKAIATLTGQNDSAVTTSSYIIDQTPPAFTALTASPDALWPTHGMMVPVQLTATATDATGIASIAILNVTSSETSDGSDWLVTGPLELQFRAKRNNGKSDRIYTVTVIATDEAGNTTEHDVQIIVPAHRGNH